MARKHVVVSVGPNRKTGKIQSACAPIIELLDSAFLGKDRTYVDEALEVGQTIEIEQSIVVSK